LTVSVEALLEPSLEEAAAAVAEALKARAWLVLAGNCETRYEGRAASGSTPGDRIVMVKPDGSVIVHGPRGFKPLNWQPDTSSVEARLHPESGTLELRAVRRSPREVLIVSCARIYYVAVLRGAEDGGFWLYVNEAEIRDEAMRDPVGVLGERLRFIEAEKPVEPGFIDALAEDEEGRLVVLEFKRVRAGEDAVRQLLRYVEAVRARTRREVRGVLVAPDATEAARRLLERSGLELRRIDLRALYERIRGRRAGRRRSLEDYLGG